MTSRNGSIRRMVTSKNESFREWVTSKSIDSKNELPWKMSHFEIDFFVEIDRFKKWVISKIGQYEIDRFEKLATSKSIDLKNWPLRKMSAA